jgi:uncharacterized protein
MNDNRSSDAPVDSPVMQSMNRFYEAEARYSQTGDAADRRALLSTLHPDIVLYQPESLPYGGEWRGREAFGRWLDAFIKAWADVTPTDPKVYACGNDLLVATVTMRARASITGKEIVMPICQVIRFADDLPIEWRNFAWDTARMLDALGIAARNAPFTAPPAETPRTRATRSS